MVWNPNQNMTTQRKSLILTMYSDFLGTNESIHIGMWVTPKRFLKRVIMECLKQRQEFWNLLLKTKESILKKDLFSYSLALLGSVRHLSPNQSEKVLKGQLALFQWPDKMILFIWKDQRGHMLILSLVFLSRRFRDLKLKTLWLSLTKLIN